MATKVVDPALLAALNAPSAPAPAPADVAPPMPGTLAAPSDADSAADALGHSNADGSYTPARAVVRGPAPVPQKVTDPAILAQLNGNGTDQSEPASPSLGGSALATASGLVSGIPIVGPLVTKASDFALSQTLGRLEGEDPGQFMQQAQAARDATNAANPIANIAGTVAGTLGSFAAGGEVPAAAEALGTKAGMGIVPKIVNSAASNAVISGADAEARGESPQQVMRDTGLGLAGGAIAPAAGEVVSAVAHPIIDRLAPAISSVTNPAQEALRRVGAAITRDQQSGQDVLRNSDLGVAADNNIPIVNADRGGETTRALVRSVANQSPEARATIDKVANDRFAGQAPRAENFIRRTFGGSADDLGYQQRLRTAATAANNPAYARAERAPAAQSVWNDDLAQLMQSNKFRAAVRSAESRGTDRAAIEGVPAVRNPFIFNDDGSVSMKPGMTPNLRFWDQVKRNLDGMLDGATRGAKPDRTVVGDLTALKAKLTGTLDNLVPEYKTARAGAAAFFGADDALEAGKNFAGHLADLPEARQAFMKFSQPEKQAFAIGYASSLIDKLRTMGDRTNVINRLFKTPAQRQAIEMILGAEKAKSVEAYVRVEDLADKLRGALGNSTTARQLAEMGIGGVAGYEFGGHDLTGALSGAMLARGGRYVLTQADGRVMQSVAKLLMSDDPAAVDKAVKQAAQSPALMRSLEKLQGLLAAPSRAAAFGAVTGQ